jgi:hypothetical protein
MPADNHTEQRRRLVIRTLKIFLPILVLMMALPQIGMAREFAEIYTDCGIGGMIAPRSDAVAAVTNVTWDLGTTAISSNISSPDSCSGGQAEKAAFIHDSYDALELDLASGHGTYLDALVALAGHEGQTQQRFIAGVRAGFAKLVAGPDYIEQNRFAKAEALYNLVNEQSEGMAESTTPVNNG